MKPKTRKPTVLQRYNQLIEYQPRPVIHKDRKRKWYQSSSEEVGVVEVKKEKPIISTQKFEGYTIPRKRKSETEPDVVTANECLSDKADRVVQNEGRQVHKPEYINQPKNPPGKVVYKFHCKVCNVDCAGPKPYNMHIAGKKHMKNVSENNKKNLEIENYLKSI